MSHHCLTPHPTTLPLLRDRDRAISIAAVHAIYEIAQEIMTTAVMDALDTDRAARGLPPYLHGTTAYPTLTHEEARALRIKRQAEHWTDLFDTAALAGGTVDQLRRAVGRARPSLDFPSIDATTVRTAVLAEFGARLTAHIAAAGGQPS